MIIRGIAATPGTAIEGMTLMGGAFDCNSDVPLLHRHERPIGRVLTLCYRGDDLHVLVETDDAAAIRATHFSPGFRVLQHDNGRVIRATLYEVSLTSTPVSEHCRVLERCAHDPIVALWHTQIERRDLLKQQVLLVQKYVSLLPTALAAMAAAAQQAQPKPPPRGSFAELAAELGRRSE